MDSSKGKTKPIPQKPKSELQQVAQQYNSLLWQLKGIKGSLSAIKYRIPQQGLLIANPLLTPPGYYRDRAVEIITETEKMLTQVKQCIRNLSCSHRISIRYTKALTKEKAND